MVNAPQNEFDDVVKPITDLRNEHVVDDLGEQLEMIDDCHRALERPGSRRKSSDPHRTLTASRTS